MCKLLRWVTVSWPQPQCSVRNRRQAKEPEPERAHPMAALATPPSAKAVRDKPDGRSLPYGCTQTPKGPCAAPACIQLNVGACGHSQFQDTGSHGRVRGWARCRAYCMCLLALGLGSFRSSECPIKGRPAPPACTLCGMPGAIPAVKAVPNTSQTASHAQEAPHSAPPCAPPHPLHDLQTAS